MPGIIDTVYVRIRPDTSGLRSETLSGVRTTLRGVQTEIQSAAKQQISATQTEISANTRLSASYQEVGTAATAASREAAAGARAAGDASAVASRQMVAGAERSAVAAGELKSRFLEIGKVLGIAFGAEILVEFTKEITKDAAQVQKSMEVIKDSFGKNASKVVTGFGESAAQSFGISASAADSFSARLGILFGNIGIAQPTAAKMTVNLIKLAGSLAAIKGVDPSTALSNLDRAMLGNVRGLKALGLSVDPALIKITALQLGLLKTGEAITPAVRAQAIYVLATARLPHFLDEAAKHSNDYANVQRRLSAEWSNAKDIIGTALLPAFDKAAGGLAKWLETQNKSGKLAKEVTADLHSFGSVLGGVKDAFQVIIPPVRTTVALLGGAHKAIRDFIIVWAGFKAAALVTGLAEVATSVLLIGTNARTATGEVAGLRTGLLRLATLGRIVVPLAVAYEITRKITHSGADFSQGTTPDTIVKAVQQGIHLEAVKGTALGDLVEKARRGMKLSQDQLVDVLQGSAMFTDDQISKMLAKTTAKTDKQLAALVKSRPGFANALVQGIANTLGTAGTEIGQAVKQWTTTPMVNAMETVGSDAAQGFKNGLKDGLVTVSTSDIQAATQKASAAAGKKASDAVMKSAQAGISDTRANIARLKETLHQTIAQNATDLTTAIESAKANLISIGSTLVSTIGQAIDAPFQQAGQNISAAQDKLSLYFAKANAALDSEGRKIQSGMDKIAAGFDPKLAALDGVSRKIQASMDKIAAVFDPKLAALDAQDRKIQALQAKSSLKSDQRTLDELRASATLGSKHLDADPQKAIKQLDALAKAHPANASAIGDFIDQFTAAAQAVQTDKIGISRTALTNTRANLQAPLDARAGRVRVRQDNLTNTRANLEATFNVRSDQNRVRQDDLANAQAAKNTPLELRAAALKVSQDAADALKTRITRQIADLTAALTSGEIRATTFTKRLAALIGKEAPSYGAAGKLLGSAFRKQFEAEAGTLAKQAVAVERAPHRAGTGQEPKVISPLLTLEKGNSAVVAAHRNIGHQQIVLQRRIANSVEKAAKAAAAARAKETKRQQKLAGARTADASAHIGATAADVMPSRESQVSKHLSGTTN